MNIDEYRAMVEQSKQEEATEQEQPVEQPIEEVQEQQPQEQVEQVENKEEEKVETFEIDGKQVTLQELKDGFMMQADYTKKTQSLSEERKRLEEVFEYIDKQKASEKEDKYKDLTPVEVELMKVTDELDKIRLERDVEKLERKYEDFDSQKVVKYSYENNVTLEDAYKIMKADNQKPFDENALREQIKTELLKEMKAEQQSTQTLIPALGNGNSVQEKEEPKLSPIEVKIAEGMGLSQKEYIKWRR